MTEPESQRYLRAASIFVSKSTGLVYEAYIAAQLGIRALAQLTIATTRVLLANKTINLDLLQKSVVQTLEATDEIKVLTQDSKNLLIAAMGILLAEVCATFTIAEIAIQEARSVVALNRSKNTTAAADVAQAKANFLRRLTEVQTASQLGALGLLGLAAFNNNVGTGINRWIPGAFAASDLIGGISDYVTVFRAGTQTTDAGKLTIIGGSFRIVGALFTLSDYLYKAFHYSWSKQYFTRVNPLQFNSFSATCSGMFYAFAVVVILYTL